MPESHKIHQQPAKKGVVAFVVLHFESAELTIQCVDSILALQKSSSYFEARVVITINPSNAVADGKVKAAFDGNDSVSIVENSENLGFSRANNIGFREAVKIFNPKHIAVLNNDIVIQQEAFLDLLDEIYEKEGLPFVIGPDIFLQRRGFHQNPLLPRLRTREEAEGYLARYRAIEEQRNNPKNVRDKLMKRLAGSPTLQRMAYVLEARKRSKNEAWKTPGNEYLLHGAALIFTRSFIDVDEPPFVPETFLYEEEVILSLRCKRNGWKTLYTPCLQVVHFGSAATESITGNQSGRQSFFRQNEIESLKILLDYWDEK